MKPFVAGTNMGRGNFTTPISRQLQAHKIQGPSEVRFTPKSGHGWAARQHPTFGGIH